MNQSHANSDRKIRSWILYDFANSIYPAVVTTAIFPVFYKSQVVGGDAGQGEWWWGRAVSTSALIVALTAPFLGAVADRGGVRKRFLSLSVAICLGGVALMTLLEPGMIVAGAFAFVVANVGFEAANVFYNAYLPDIAPRKEIGRISGRGFGMGYLGSALGLLIVLPFVLFPDTSGYPEPLARVLGGLQNLDFVWLTVIAFFLGFSIPAFRHLPGDAGGAVDVRAAAREGLASTGKILREVWRHKNLRRFLGAYFFYIDGVLTVIVMAALIAEGTFGFNQQQIIILFLIVQFSALVGALTLAGPTDSIGPKKVLTGVLVLWVVAGVWAYFVESPRVFYVLAIAAGFGLGSVQSASRALMASMVPKGREAELFGFYALCGRSSSVLGPWLFGLVTLMAGGNQRPGFLVLTGLFLVGLVLLQRVRDPRMTPRQAR